MRLIDADVLKQHIDKLPALPDGNFAGNHSALKALINMQPTIEPSTNCSEFPNNSTLQPICNQLATDCISRQAAIDALNTGFWGVEWDKALATAILKDLPSAQPEEAIPVSWIEARIKRFMTMDNAFGGLTASIMLVMLNEWKREQEGETE